MRISEEIRKLTTDDTIILEAILDGDGNITSINHTNIKDAADMNIIGTNIIMNAILTKNYGIDVRGICKDFIDDNVPGVVCMSSFLKNCDWENAVVKDNSTTPATIVSAIDYIRDKFLISKSDVFVDEVYSRVQNAFVSAQYNYKENFVYVHLDGETNQMINILAVIIGSNNTFMDIPVGVESYVNIPLDPSHIENFFEEIRKILVEDGYLSSSIASLTLDSRIDTMINPNEWFNSEGDYKYGHLFIAKNTSNNRWRPYVYFTPFVLKEPVYLNYIVIGGDHDYCFVPILVNEADNLTYIRRYILITPARERYRQYTFTMNWGNQIFSSLDNMLATDDVTNRYYNCTYENSSLGDRVWPKIGTTDNGYTGPYTSDNTEIEQVIINNKHYGGTAGIHQPTIDQITEQNLEDNNIGLVGIDDDLDVFLTYQGISSIYHPSDMPFDTSFPLKIGTCDPVLGVLLNDPNTTVTNFLQVNRAKWHNLWSKGIHLKYNSMIPVKLGMGMPYYLTEDMLCDVGEDLWNDSFWTELGRGLKDPMECILFLRQLPYTLKEGIDYSTFQSSLADRSFYNDDGTAPIRYGNVVPIRNGGKSKGYLISNAVHEITFVLKGKNKVQLHNNFTDYSPYVKTMIFLPFVGTREVPPEFIMKTDLIVKYRISNITGDFVCTLSSMNEYTNEVNTNGELPLNEQYFSSGAPILIEHGNMAIERVWSGQTADSKGIWQGMTQAIASCLGSYRNSGQTMSSSGRNTSNSTNRFNTQNSTNTTGTGLSHAFSSSIGKTVGDTISDFTNNMTSQLSSLNSQIDFGGVFTGISNTLYSVISGDPVNHNNVQASDGKLLDVRYPYIIMSYNPIIEDCGYYTAFDKTIGYASMHGIRIKNMTAHYHELMSVKVEGINCTSTERDMIKNILMGGFYNGLNKGEQLSTPE